MSGTRAIQQGAFDTGKEFVVDHMKRIDEAAPDLSVLYAAGVVSGLMRFLIAKAGPPNAYQMLQTAADGAVDIGQALDSLRESGGA